MRKISVMNTAVVNTAADKAWEVVGPGFVDISVWGPGIYRSWNNDSIEARVNDAPAGGRFCDLGKQGIFDERIIHYDKAEREISWSAESDKLPGFITSLRNGIKVEVIDERSCRISSNITAKARGPIGLLLAGVVQKQFAKTLPEFLDAWKFYAETGQLSVSKQREMAQQAIQNQV